jgi:hypothetical protein
VRSAALVLALLAASPGEPPEVLSVERGTLEVTGEPAAVEINGGCWLSEKRCVRTAAEIERLRAENESLRKQAGDSKLVVVLVAFALGMGAGFAVAKAAK